MKAAVLKAYGTIPEYAEVAEPIVANDHQLLVKPIASSIKQLDKSKASGKHYTNFGKTPAVMGMDGVVKLEDGTLAYASGVDGKGLMAEQALVVKESILPLPENINPALAAALPNVLMGSDMAMVKRGQLKSGAVVFVNGATGNTGMTAVQMAKIRGAKRVIATGRNPEKLELLKTMGADVTINLTQPEDELIQAIVKVYQESPFDMVLDYLWGHPAELLFQALGQVKLSQQLKYVTIGGMAGDEISLSSQLFRGNDLVLIGSGIGSLTEDERSHYTQTELPKVFEYAADGKITLPLNAFPLEKVAEAWQTSQSVVLI